MMVEGREMAQVKCVARKGEGRGKRSYHSRKQAERERNQSEG